MSALSDGVHDAMVIDATRLDDGNLRVELVITTGAHKGEVVRVRVTGGNADADADGLDLLGRPATIAVAEGSPAVTFE